MGFSGDYELRWLEPRLYLYQPAPDDPLTFTRPDGQRIVLSEPFETDGATIPRIFWPLPGFSPWDFFPAALIHDWLWELRHHGRIVYGFWESNRVIYEACRALGVPRWRAWLIRWNINLFGWWMWLEGEQGA